MTYTLDVDGDRTYVNDAKGQPLGFIEPDYQPDCWASYLKNNNPEFRHNGGWALCGQWRTPDDALTSITEVFGL